MTLVVAVSIGRSCLCFLVLHLHALSTGTVIRFPRAQGEGEDAKSRCHFPSTYNCFKLRRSNPFIPPFSASNSFPRTQRRRNRMRATSSATWVQVQRSAQSIIRRLPCLIHGLSEKNTTTKGGCTHHDLACRTHEIINLSKGYRAVSGRPLHGPTSLGRTTSHSNSIIVVRTT